MLSELAGASALGSAVGPGVLVTGETVEVGCGALIKRFGEADQADALE